MSNLGQNFSSHPQALNADTSAQEVGILDIDGPGFVEGYEDEKGDFEPEPLAARTRRPTLPGVVLRDLYLPRVGLNVTELADHLFVSRRSVSQLVNGSRSVSVDMAARLSRALGTSPEFWLNLQRDVDVWDALQEFPDVYEKISTLPRAA